MCGDVRARSPKGTGDYSQTNHASVQSSERYVLRVSKLLSPCPGPVLTLHASRQAAMARAHSKVRGSRLANHRPPPAANLLAPPGSERARIQVHKIRRTVVSDAAALQAQGVCGKIRAIDTGHTHINGASLDVQTMPCNARAPLVQPRVGLWRPVA